MAHERSSCKYKQHREDELVQQQQLQHNAQIQALQARRKARLITALVCLQLSAPHKPGLPQLLVQHIGQVL